VYHTYQSNLAQMVNEFNQRTVLSKEL